MLTWQKEIALIIPYYGKWPRFLSIFLKGCEANKWLDVIFVTDCPTPSNHPENVYFISSTLDDFSRRIKEKLLIDYKLKNPYKLCDYKTTYGVLFDDLLKDYKYWAYGDIDLIYGNLKKFISPLLNSNIELISFRFEILSGSFVILKNSEKMNRLFSKSKDYIKALSSDKHFSFSETNLSSITWKGKTKLDLRTPVESMTYVAAREAEAGNINAHFETMIVEKIFDGDIVSYNHGKLLLNTDKEIAYYHMVCNKGDKYFIIPSWVVVPEKFYITTTGFYTPAEFKNKILLGNLRKAKGKFLMIVNKVNRKFGLSTVNKH